MQKVEEGPLHALGHVCITSSSVCLFITLLKFGVLVNLDLELDICNTNHYGRNAQVYSLKRRLATPECKANYLIWKNFRYRIMFDEL